MVRVRDRGIMAVLMFMLGWCSALGAQERGDEGPFDVVIVGGRVMDGTGNPAFYGDVGIRDDEIVVIGSLDGVSARRRIDARGRIVMPGFIDLHTHADGEKGLGSEDPRRRAARNLVAQGITTVLANSDGRSPWPIRDQRTRLSREGIGPNVILQVGHGTVRGRVMGEDYRRPATPGEVEEMRKLVKQALEEGAWGLSAGLAYLPGRWSTTDEVVALTEEIVPFGGTYIAHVRSQASHVRWYLPSREDVQDPPYQFTLLDATEETIEIGERTGATVVQTHIKARGADYEGAAYAAIRLIEKARSRGVDVWADQYPYTSGGADGRVVLLPDWALEGVESGGTGYWATLEKVLADSRASEDLRRDVSHRIAHYGGPERIVVFEYPERALLGKSIMDLASDWETSPVDVVIRLQKEGFPDRPGGARLRGFSFADFDVEALMRQTWVASSTDAGIALPEDGLDIHARFYGSYPRKFRVYAIERGVVSVEDVVRSSTTLPAQILGLRDRGMIHEGFKADIVVVDLERIRDRATFVDPQQFPEGIEYVLVNGQLVVEREHPTNNLPGVVITRH